MHKASAKIIDRKAVTSKQVPISDPYNRESKSVIEPSKRNADLIPLVAGAAPEAAFSFEWSICINIKNFKYSP